MSDHNVADVERANTQSRSRRKRRNRRRRDREATTPAGTQPISSSEPESSDGEEDDEDLLLRLARDKDIRHVQQALHKRVTPRASVAERQQEAARRAAIERKKQVEAMKQAVRNEARFDMTMHAIAGAQASSVLAQQTNQGSIVLDGLHVKVMQAPAQSSATPPPPPAESKGEDASTVPASAPAVPPPQPTHRVTSAPLDKEAFAKLFSEAQASLVAKQWKHAVAQWQRLVGSAQQQRDADPRKLGTCIANLGLAFQGGGASNKALACFQHALAMLSPLEGTAPQQIMLLANLATMYKTAGNIGAATQCLNRAARIRAQPQQPAAGAHPRVSAGQLDAAITAAKDGKFGAVVKLLKGADTRGAVACHHHSATGVTALMLAAALCKLPELALLIDAGADLEAKDAQGFTPLFYAARFKRAKAVEDLLQRGADVGAVLAKKPLASFKPQIRQLLSGSMSQESLVVAAALAGATADSLRSTAPPQPTQAADASPRTTATATRVVDAGAGAGAGVGAGAGAGAGAGKDRSGNPPTASQPTKRGKHNKPNMAAQAAVSARAQAREAKAQAAKARTTASPPKGANPGAKKKPATREQRAAPAKQKQQQKQRHKQQQRGPRGSGKRGGRGGARASGNPPMPSSTGTSARGADSAAQPTPGQAVGMAAPKKVAPAPQLPAWTGKAAGALAGVQSIGKVPIGGAAAAVAAADLGANVAGTSKQPRAKGAKPRGAKPKAAKPKAAKTKSQPQGTAAAAPSS